MLLAKKKAKPSILKQQKYNKALRQTRVAENEMQQMQQY
jgi:hypothetical protein